MGGPAGSLVSLRSRQHCSRGHRSTLAPPPRQGSSLERKGSNSRTSTEADASRTLDLPVPKRTHLPLDHGLVSHRSFTECKTARKPALMIKMDHSLCCDRKGRLAARNKITLFCSLQILSAGLSAIQHLPQSCG